MEGKKKDWWFIGIAASSIFYFIAVWSILAINLNYSPTPPDGLNSIGDYLAGAFSPLAFFWLAYGYWMQNKELRSNNKHQANSLSIAEKNLDLQNNIMRFESVKEFNASQAFFEISHLKNTDKKLLIELKNHNATVFDFIFGEYEENVEIPITSKTILRNETIELELELELEKILETKEQNISQKTLYMVNHKEKFYIRYKDSFERDQFINIRISSLLINNDRISYSFHFYNRREPLPEIPHVY